jgi:hypothetical protein
VDAGSSAARLETVGNLHGHSTFQDRADRLVGIESASLRTRTPSLLATVVALAAVASPVLAARGERLASRHVALDLPGPPSKVVPSDLDGDGRTDLVVVVAYTEIEEIGHDDVRLDLVLGYWKGLMDDKAVLDAYLRKPDGSFDTAPRTTAFNVKDGDRDFLRYGADLDGDGNADLLLRDDENRLLLYPGLASANGKRLVDKQPRRISLGPPPGWEEFMYISIGGGETWRADLWNTRRPRLLDVDGDGREEIVVVQRGSSDRPGVLRIVRP